MGNFEPFRIKLESVFFKIFSRRGGYGEVYGIHLEKYISFQKIPKKLLEVLYQYFIPKDKSISAKKNEFLIAGNFNKKFDVNYCFCIWLDHENSTLVYRSKKKEDIKIKLEKYEKLEKVKFSLICSKYKIKYIYHKK